MVVRVSAGSSLVIALYALVLIMLSSAAIRGAVSAIGLLLCGVVSRWSLSSSVAEAGVVAVVTVVAVSGCGRGCRCGLGGRRGGLRCLVNADDTAGDGSSEVEDGLGVRSWHSFAAHHLRAHHGGLHFVVVMMAMGADRWVSSVAAETVEVTEAASTAGAARTARTTSAERTVSAGADLS